MSDKTSNPATRATRVRYAVVAVCMVMSWLLYLDRFCVGMAEPYIKQDLNLSTFQVGIFFSAFFLTYALFQVPSGWMSDRYGSRIMLAIYIVAWSLFTSLMGLSYGFGMLLLMRAAYGLGQAGAYPTSASILSKWVPISQRGLASGLVAFGGRVGGAVAPVLTAVLIVSFVPVSEPSTIGPEDIRNGAGISAILYPTDSASSQPASIRYLVGLMPISGEGVLTAVARRNQEAVARKGKLETEIKKLQRSWRLIQASRLASESAAIEMSLERNEREFLVQVFNEWIALESFYQPAAFASMNRLDRAALTYMKQVENGEVLSTKDRQRFNRLLLEGCFPDELSKVYVAGWRPVIIYYGLFGLLIAGLFFFVVRNSPAVHPRCNAEEVRLIESGQKADSVAGPIGKLPWGPLLKSRSMWLNCCSQVGTNIGWVFIVTWFPRFLLEQHQVPIIERGIMASTPLFLGWFGMLGGGRLTDFLVPRVGVRWARRLPWSVSRFVGMAAFIACPSISDPWTVTLVLSVVAISTDLGTASTWAFCQDVGGKHVGSVLGWGNMWGNLGATVSPVLLAWIFESYSWTIMFYVCATAFFLAGVTSLGVDATIKIAYDDDNPNQVST